MCRSWLGSLYLHEALGADGLIAAAGVVDVGGVVLGRCQRGRGEGATTDQEADGTFDGGPVEGGFGTAGGVLEGGGAPGGGGGPGCGGVGGGAVGVLGVPACGEDLGVVPVVGVVLEGAVEGGELPVDDELGDDGVVPVSRPGVDTLRGEEAEVDGVIVVGAARGRAGVAHGVDGVAVLVVGDRSVFGRCLAPPRPGVPYMFGCVWHPPGPARPAPRQCATNATFSNDHPCCAVDTRAAPDPRALCRRPRRGSRPRPGRQPRPPLRQKRCVRPPRRPSPLTPSRAPRGPPDAPLAARPRPVQGPARPHPPRVRRRLLPPRPLRGHRRLQPLWRLCRARSHLSHPHSQRRRRRRPGNKRRKGHRCRPLVPRLTPPHPPSGPQRVFSRRSKCFPRRPLGPHTCLRARPRRHRVRRRRRQGSRRLQTSLNFFQQLPRRPGNPHRRKQQCQQVRRRRPRSQSRQTRHVQHALLRALPYIFLILPPLTFLQGTTVVNGTARAVVTFTGQKTAIGHIHHSISQQITEKTPLKRKLDDFGDMLAKVISVICILVWLVNFRHFWDPSHHGPLRGAIYYFKIAVALAVAAIPEGLAAVITACLALGTKKMAQKNAIVRNLPSVETLGCTNVICSDKTGTLTTNQMSVSKVHLYPATCLRSLLSPFQFTIFDAQSLSPSEYQVEGATYSPHGSVRPSGGKSFDSSLEPIRRLAEICAVCNDAKIIYQAVRSL